MKNVMNRANDAESRITNSPRKQHLNTFQHFVFGELHENSRLIPLSGRYDLDLDLEHDPEVVLDELDELDELEEPEEVDELIVGANGDLFGLLEDGGALIIIRFLSDSRFTNASLALRCQNISNELIFTLARMARLVFSQRSFCTRS